MADQPTPENEATEDVISESELKAWIDESVKSALSGFKPSTEKRETPAAKEASVKDEVSRAIKEAQADEAKATRERMIDDRLDKLEKAKEDVPNQFRKITRLMWGDQ